MELRHLKYFVAVAEMLSFTKAAHKLRTAQPSLTRQVRDLEQEIGVQLLERNRQQVRLTDAGRAFLPDAKRLLAIAVEIVDNARRISRDVPVTLNIGYVANLFYQLLPTTLAALREALPLVAVNLFDMSCGDQLAALETGIIDLAFVGPHEPVELRGLSFKTIGHYNTVAALPEQSALANRATVNLKDLAAMFFIGMSEQSYPHYRDWLTRSCESAGFRPKVLQDVHLERSMIHAVASGLGVALVPEQLERIEHEHVVFRPVKPSITTEGCVAWKPGNTSSALKLYLEIVEQANQTQRPRPSRN